MTSRHPAARRDPRLDLRPLKVRREHRLRPRLARRRSHAPLDRTVDDEPAKRQAT